MTLQNEPPTLENCAEDRDQYKQYSKTFRSVESSRKSSLCSSLFASSKMIEQCLQKNPADRPTAKQLLKHDFFKKAKDRSYIAKHLALKLQDRKKMEEKIVNRRKPQSVRAVRLSDSGEWKFSSGSDDEATSGDEVANKLKQAENQTVRNIGDIIDKVDSATKPVRRSLDRSIHTRHSSLSLRLHHRMKLCHKHRRMKQPQSPKKRHRIRTKCSN